MKPDVAIYRAVEVAVIAGWSKRKFDTAVKRLRKSVLADRRSMRKLAVAESKWENNARKGILG